MSEPASFRRRQLVALILALIAAGSMLDYHLGYFIPRMLAVRAASGGGNGYSFGDDFYPVWLTTREWQAHRVDLYSPQMTREIQVGLFGRAIDPANPHDPPTDYRQFAYPPFTDLIFWPASLLDFTALRIGLAVLLPLLTILSIRFWLLALDWQISPLWFAVTCALTLCTYELLEAFFAEQPGVFVGFFLASAALAIRRNRLVLAGVLMSLTLIKPQVTALAMGYSLFWSFADRRRASFWIAFCGTTLCMGAASLLLWPHWIGEWVGILLGYHLYAGPSLLGVLLGSSAVNFLGPALTAVAVLLSLTFAWKMRGLSPQVPQFWLAFAILLAVTCVVLLPGLAVYDHIILLPGILLLLRSSGKLRYTGPVARALLSAGALVLFWPWISSFCLLLIRPLAPVVFHSAKVFLLPIRTAASLPFVVLALLFLMWRATASKIETAS